VEKSFVHGGQERGGGGEREHQEEEKVFNHIIGEIFLRRKVWRGFGRGDLQRGRKRKEGRVV